MSLPHLSRRARQTPPSPIRRLSHLAHAATARGIEVYHLNIGQPDIETPPEYFEGLKHYKSRVVAYERSQGNDEFRRAWSNYINREMNASTSEDQLLITTGASEALVFLFMTLCDPGDEVIVFDPTYANYIGFAAIAGVRLVAVPSHFEQNFALPSLEQIEKEITLKTRAILICNPNNPTGTVYPHNDLAALVALCEERNIFLVADETYREFVYDGRKPVSLLDVAPQSNRVVIVDSLSKRFSLCGARLGCLLTNNQEILSVTVNIAQARLAAPTMEQLAAAFMLNTIGPGYLSNVVSEYERRRNVLMASLSKLSTVTAQTPQGAFYCVADLPGVNAEDFASFLLSDFSLDGHTTFVAPAAGFYMNNQQGFSKIRIAYVLESNSIERAIRALGEGLEQFRRRQGEFAE